MAYQKHTWQCDEPITAQKLNNIEEGIAEASEGGSCDCGFECTEVPATLTNETVTTAVDPDWPDSAAQGALSYSQLIDADTIAVTLNGTKYKCSRMQDGSYGAPRDETTDEFDWSVYPFVVFSSYSPLTQTTTNGLITETPGTYAIKIEGITRNATTTPCFEAAVRSIVEPLIPVVNTPLVVSATKTPSTGTIGDPSVIRMPVGLIKNAMKSRGVIVEDSTGQLYTVVAADQAGILLEGRGAGDAVAHYYYNWTTDSMGFLYCPAAAQ